MSSKAQIHADSLLQKLKNRLGAAVAVAKAFDTDFQPLITIGPGTAGSNSAILKIAAEVSLFKNAIGLAQEVYTPHRLQIAFEDVSATAGVVNRTLTEATKAKIMADALNQGFAVDVYVLANGTAPTAANLATAVAAAAGPTATLPPDIFNPLTNQQ